MPGRSQGHVSHGPGMVRTPRYSGAQQPEQSANPQCPTLKGFTPDRLPPHSCHSPPIFAIPQPLGRLFRKVGQLLLNQCRPPCEYLPCPLLTCSYLSDTCLVLHTTVMLLTCSVTSHLWQSWMRMADATPCMVPDSAPPKFFVSSSGPFTPDEASGPGEDGSDPDSMGCSEVRAQGAGLRAGDMVGKQCGFPHSKAGQRGK